MTGRQALNGFSAANNVHALTGSLARLVKVIQGVGRPCIVCSRHPFGHQEVAALLSQPFVEGIILESENHELLAAFPHQLGYYTKNGSDWQLPSNIAADMIYVGPWSDFGARVAWLAWRAGIRRIHNASAYQSHHKCGANWVLVEKALNSMIYRLRQSLLELKLAEITGILLRLDQFLFSRRLRAIDDLPLPIAGAPTAWQQRTIVMVGGTLGPGGAERQLTATLLGLFARGHREVHFLHHSPMHKPNDFFLPQLIEAGVPFSQVDLLGDSNPVSPGIEEEFEQRLAPLGDLGAEVAAYAREFLVRRPEIVHVWLDHINVVAGLAALLVGVPRIVLSCRSLSPVHFAFIQPYMRPLYRLLAKNPNVTFLNNSEAGAMDYGRWLGITPLAIRVVRNGFDFSLLPSPQELSHLRSEYRHRLGIPAHVPVVGVIMRISEEKRPLLWIEIACQVAKQIPEAHFLIVGDGPMREQVEAVGQAALPGKIHFPGHEQNAAMALAAMDMFLLTSRIEGLPNVLIEAQAVGVPPVTLDVGGARETLNDERTGWLIKSADPLQIADKIQSLFRNREHLEAASRNGPRFVTQHFSHERMLDQTTAVYGLHQQ